MTNLKMTAVVFVLWTCAVLSSTDCASNHPERVADGTISMNSVAFEQDPPGARIGHRYEGRVSPIGPARGAVKGTKTIEAVAHRPDGIRDVRVTKTGDDMLTLECVPTNAAAPTERIDVVLTLADREVTGSIYLNVVEGSWDTAWRPVAVATVEVSTVKSPIQVRLDATKSTHPAGRGAMMFSWWIDGGAEVIKGADVTSSRLSPGRHTIVLVAEDRFGYVSRDTVAVDIPAPR